MTDKLLFLGANQADAFAKWTEERLSKSFEYVIEVKADEARLDGIEPGFYGINMPADEVERRMAPLTKH